MPTKRRTDTELAVPPDLVQRFARLEEMLELQQHDLSQALALLETRMESLNTRLTEMLSDLQAWAEEEERPLVRHRIN